MTKIAYTENGAIQYEKSGNGLVSFLEKSAAQRAYIFENEDNLISLFNDAYRDDREIATKLLFRLRDPRNGSGEKAAFNKILYHIYLNSPSLILDNLNAVVKYGSYQNLIKLMKFVKLNGNISDYNSIITFFSEKIKSKDRLANKWAPRLHSDDDSIAKDLRDSLAMSNKEYRKWLKEYSETIEQQMAKGEWSGINYEHIPSMSMKKYKKAFNRRDFNRFEEFKNDTTKKVNSSVLYPHQVIKMLNSDPKLAEKMWANLPDFITKKTNIYPMIDVSTSMLRNVSGGTENIFAMLVAIALGLYLSEKNKSVFKNSFLTFDSNPRMMKFEDGLTLKERYEFIRNSPWGGSTNFESAYKLILDTAIKNKLTQEELPEILLCLSDMQFDQSSYKSPHVKVFKDMYEQHGYKAPKLVFWNLCESFTGSPSRWNTSDIGLISGFSPSIMKAVLSVEDFNPLEIVYESVKYIDDLVFDNLPVSLRSKSFSINNDLL